MTTNCRCCGCMIPSSCLLLLFFLFLFSCFLDTVRVLTCTASIGSALTPVRPSDRGWSKEAILALATIFIMILLSSMGAFFKYRSNTYSTFGTIFKLRFAPYFPLHFGSKWRLKRQGTFSYSLHFNTWILLKLIDIMPKMKKRQSHCGTTSLSSGAICKMRDDTSRKPIPKCCVCE